MISADLIGRIASERKVDPGIIEKDYVLSKALSALAGMPEAQANLMFKGGTALKKFYYVDWRYSEDLDFTAKTAMPPVAIQGLFERLANHVTEVYGVNMRVAEYSQYPREGSELVSAQLKLGYDGPLHKSSGLKNNVRVDIAFEELIVEAPKPRPMFSLYPDDSPTMLPVYVIEEIVAEKLRSILQRGKSRDYYDVWVLLKDYAKDFDHALTKTILNKKCGFKDIPDPKVDDFFKPEQLAEAERFWERGLAHQLHALPPFAIVITQMKTQVGSIINGNSNAEYSS